MVLSVDGRDVASQRIPKSFIPKARIGNEVSTVFAEGACVRVSVGEVGVRPLRFARIERGMFPQSHYDLMELVLGENRADV